MTTLPACPGGRKTQDSGGRTAEYGTIVSPHRYVRLSRIRKNARLFLAGQKSRMEVALEVG
jgi:hypothetical protein